VGEPGVQADRNAGRSECGRAGPRGGLTAPARNLAKAKFGYYVKRSPGQGTRFATLKRGAAPELGSRHFKLGWGLTSPGFAAVSSALIDELQDTLGYEKVIPAETEAETMSKDCDWPSPVLKKRLERWRASAAVKIASGLGRKAVFAIGCRNDLLVTERGGDS